MNRQLRSKSKISRTSAMKQVKGKVGRVTRPPDDGKPANLEQLVTQLLTVLGEDPKRIDTSSIEVPEFLLAIPKAL